MDNLFKKWAEHWFVGEWSVLKPTNPPQQVDSYSCGVFVAMAIYDVVVDGQLPRGRTPNQIALCRRWLHACLCAREIIDHP